MSKTITVSMFRRFERIHDEMARAAMPRTSVADPRPLAADAGAARMTELVAKVNGARLVRPLTVKLSEVL